MSATKQWAIDNNKDWKPYWYDKDTKLVHLLAKTISYSIIFDHVETA
jgi:methionyl-tRNA synthetase